MVLAAGNEQVAPPTNWQPAWGSLMNPETNRSMVRPSIQLSKTLQKKNCTTGGEVCTEYSEINSVYKKEMRNIGHKIRNKTANIFKYEIKK